MSRIRFQKRQKEMKRQQKQQEKAEKRAMRKLAKTSDAGAEPQLLDDGTEIVADGSLDDSQAPIV